MKQKYINKKPSLDSLNLIYAAQQILEEFQVRMTVRQLYYQLVARDMIPNSVRSYKRVVRIMRDARMAGLLDWDWIEDRLRKPTVPSTWSDIDSIIEAAKASFRLDRWADQDYYLEVWVEKDALAGICGDACLPWQVPLQVNRGYSSVSAMRESALRLRSRGRGRRGVVIGYLGDHDPSGEDMVRDIRDRLALFGADVEVVKLAISHEDIEEYDLPPQPVKNTDARADAFRAAHGEDCVELDALRPDVLKARIEEFIEGRLDRDKYEAVKEEEDLQRESVIVNREED